MDNFIRQGRDRMEQLLLLKRSSRGGPEIYGRHGFDTAMISPGTNIGNMERFSRSISVGYRELRFDTGR